MKCNTFLVYIVFTSIYSVIHSIQKFILMTINILTEDLLHFYNFYTNSEGKRQTFCIILMYLESNKNVDNSKVNDVSITIYLQSTSDELDLKFNQRDV